jgi:hypothetical protein
MGTRFKLVTTSCCPTTRRECGFSSQKKAAAHDTCEINFRICTVRRKKVEYYITTNPAFFYLGGWKVARRCKGRL